MKNALLTIPELQTIVNKNTRTTLFVRLFCDIYAHFYSLPSLEICFPFCHFTTKLSCKDNQHFFLSFKIGCIFPLFIQINELRRMDRQIIGLFHILKKKCHLMQTGRDPQPYIKLRSYTMILHASMINNILLYTSKTLCPLSAYTDITALQRIPKTIRCRDKTLGALALLFCELKATSLLLLTPFLSTHLFIRRPY